MSINKAVEENNWEIPYDVDFAVVHGLEQSILFMGLKKFLHCCPQQVAHGYTWHIVERNDISEAFGFWSKATVFRLLDHLKAKGLLDYTKWEQGSIIIRFGKPDKNINVDSGYIYLMYAPLTNAYKIGKSVNPYNRAKKMPFVVDVIHTIPTGNMSQSEAALHSRFNDKQIEGEWFNLSDDDVATICQIERL